MRENCANKEQAQSLCVSLVQSVPIIGLGFASLSFRNQATTGFYEDCKVSWDKINIEAIKETLSSDSKRRDLQNEHVKNTSKYL